MSCLLKIRTSREQMATSEKKLADFILANAALIRDYSSQQLASSVGVSQSSVVKFSQKLGYKGFTDLKLAIHETVVRQESGGVADHERVPSDAAEQTVSQKVLHSKCEILASTGLLNDDEHLIAAVRAIETGNRVQVTAVGAATLVAKDFATKLMVLGYTAAADMDTYIQLSGVATLGKGDILFVICASGQTRSLIHMAQQARKAGVTIVTLTAYNTSPINALADIRLFSVTHNGQPDIPHILEPASQQHVLDLLFYYLIERNSHGRELLIRWQKTLADLVQHD
jgi:DNA-binding MurR/RpiR family transcriptional regulator